MGVFARLIAAIAVPVVVLSLVLGASVIERHDDVRRAGIVSARVALLEQLVTLRSALFQERLAAEVFLPSRRPSDELLASTEFGARLSEDPGRLVEDTDDALAAIPPADRPIDRDDLEAARAAQPDVVPGSTEISRRFDHVDRELGRAITAQLTVVRESAIQLGDVDMIRAGTIFQRSVELPEGAGALVADLADLWAADEDRARLQTEVAVTLANFRRSSTGFSSAFTDPQSSLSTTSADVLVVPDALSDAIDQALSGALSSPDRPALQPADVGVALLEGVDWILRVDAIPELAAEAATNTAQDVAESASDSERRVATLALGAIVVSIAAAVWFGRSIVKPVRRLTDQAERIGGGQLEFEPLDRHGPPEIVRASDAMHDVVDNLVLLEAKGQALARADFDDPALQQQMPGRLGASLQLSMEVLSASIEERESLQSRLRFEATHDSLTGLGNRASLVALLGSRRHGGGLAVIFIDLNDFKGINDRHGHPVGDQVLKVVGDRMLSVAPARALVTRLGGDEFVIALPDVDGIDEPLEVARRVTRAVVVPFEVDGRVVEVGASAGVAVSGFGSLDVGPEALLRMADMAVYSAKLDPNENIAVYDEDLDRRLTHQRSLESALTSALHSTGDELRLVFQPIVRAADSTVDGVEALLRWSPPGRAAVPPDVFIPIAEHSDLILDVDHWVIGHALRHMAQWPAEGAAEDLSVSVNVSGRSLLDRTFVDRVTGLLAVSDVAASRLQVEVTETALVSDLDLAAEQLAQLRALGVRVVIDDFGTGYTSVAHLRTLPVDELKIDGGFVSRLHDDPEDRVLIEMITQLAHQLDLPVVAEGVETDEQAELLRVIGCDLLQGYLFSPPVEADEVPDLLGPTASLHHRSEGHLTSRR